MNQKKILWLITARKNSKSIPDKNIKLLGGYPLISFRIKSALATKFPKDIWVSTDSEEYARLSQDYGASIPFIRPDFLASDDASSVDVVLHAMDFATKKNLKYDYIGLLEPTSPFINSTQLDLALNTLNSSIEASAIVAIRESRPNRIFIQEDSRYLTELADNIRSLTKIGRQFFKKEITPSGGFYISKWDNFLVDKTFYSQKTLGYYVDDISGLEIDEPLDWEFAEFIIEKKLFDKNKVFN